MKIVWVLVAVVLIGAGYGLGRIGEKEEVHSGPPPKAAIIVPKAGDVAPENVEFITALHAALDEPMLLDRTAKTAERLGQLSESNVADALRAIRTGTTSRELKALLFDSWVRFDAPAALAHALTLSPFLRETTIPPLLEGWATLDPTAARRAYERLPEAAPQDRLSSRTKTGKNLMGLAKGWARSGHPGLMEFLAQQAQSMQRQDLVAFAIELLLGRVGPEAVQEWADELAEGDLPQRFKQIVLKQTAAALTRIDGSSAAAWAATYADTEFAARVLSGVSNGWIVRDSDATMNWFLSLPDNDARETAMKQAYGFWLKNHLEKAQAWMEAAEPERAWEPARALYAESLADTDPKAAVTAAGEISDLALRAESLVVIGQTWYRKSPGPATAWLEQSDLTTEQRERVTHPPRAKRKGSGGAGRARPNSGQRGGPVR